MKKDWSTQALITRIEANRNPDFAVPMAAYMRGKFPFLGIKAPLRKELVKEHISKYLLPKQSQLSEVVWEIYHLPEREYQYIAIEILERMKNSLTVDDLPFLRNLIESNSWWDSVDVIAARIVGPVVLANRKDGSPIMLDWSQSDNLWTIRSAILHQLKYKEQTDTILLRSLILRHAGSTEFFLQKSIGWALREYAKTDAEWVRSFVEIHHLSPLSTREALKHIT